MKRWFAFFSLLALLITPAAGQNVNIPEGKPPWTSLTPANPTGTTSLTPVMAGIAVPFTPRSTGEVAIDTSMQMLQTTGGSGCSVTIRFGTGAAPANGAAATGTIAGQTISSTLMLANQSLTASPTGRITGLTVGTAYWFDIAFATLVAGNCSLFGISMVIQER